jgi:hypothetical protein
MKRSLRISRALTTAVLAACCAGAPVTDAQAEAFLDIGASSTRVEAVIATLDTSTSTETGFHLGGGVRRGLKGGGNIGVRVELDDIDTGLLLAVRALDYRYSLSDHLALTAFLGAARLDLATPAYGYYLGGGFQFKELVAAWDLSIDVRIGDKLARDNVLPSDPHGGSDDNFYTLGGISVYLSRRF